MEYAVELNDGSNLGEKNCAEDEFSESRVENMAVVGAHGLQDTDGEEVYEEAVESELRKIDSDECFDKICNSGDSSENDKMNVGHESDRFEEAIGVPIQVQNREELPVTVEENRGFLVDVEPVHDAAMVGMLREQIVPENISRHEFDGSVGFVDNGEHEKRVVSDPTAAGEMQIWNGGYELNVTSESGGTDSVNLDETLVYSNSIDRNADKQEMEVHEGSETKVYNEVDGDDTVSLQDSASSGGILQLDKSNVKENESWGILDPANQPYANGEVEDASVVLSDEQADEVVESNHSMVKMDLESEGGNTRELKEEGSASMSPEDRGVAKAEEQKDTSFNLNPEYLDGLMAEPKDIPTAIESANRGKSCKEEGSLHVTMQERIVTPEVRMSPRIEDSVVKTDEKIQTNTADLGIENFKDSQFQHAEVTVKVSNGVAKEPENKSREDGEVKQNTVGNKEPEIWPTADVPSMIGKSANSAPTSSRPAGLGHTAPLLEPAFRAVQQPRVNGTVSPMQNQVLDDPTNGEADENDETREKLQMIRVKFLRLAHRLGQTPHNVVVAQVLYRLGLAEQLRGRNGGRVAAFSFDRASAMAEQLEASGNELLDFSCTVMVLGKTGVGKSATINSIFDEIKFGTDAFQSSTKKVQDVLGAVQGIKVRVIDTPGLLPSWSDQRQNEKILSSVKRFIRKTPPDIVLYLDRLDMQSRDFGDMPLLRTITEIFGPSIWFNAIVVLTHAASAPPEGPNGAVTSYDMFVTQRSHVVQQAIRQAAGDMRLMNPVSLVENHSACRTNRAGQRVLPNGQVWKPHLLLLSFASKILAEANTLLKLQDNPPGKPFAVRVRAPPLPFILSSLLQSRPQVKLPSEQFGDDDDTIDDLDESSDSDDDSEYDELPPFELLSKAQLAKLAKTQRKAYYDELEYRERLFMKKQLKEEKKRRKLIKKTAAATKDLQSHSSDNADEESSGAGSVPVPMPDLALPASFDSDNPTHRYRCLDSFNQWLVRPVLETHGWDHDVGYEGINAERLFLIKDNMPLSFSGQVTKDKRDTNLQMEIASTVKHAEGKATSLGFDMQTIGKDMAYTIRSETRISNHRRNKATAGLSVTVLGDILTAGLKVEDKLIVNKQGKVVASGGVIIGRGDIAYGGSLEASLREKDHPLGRFFSTFGLSVMDWHGDLAIGWNANAQIPVGRSTNLIGRVNFNNRGSGQVSIRLNSSEQLQIALVGLIPLLRKLLVNSQSAEFAQ